MKNPPPNGIQSIDANSLNPIVRQALQRDSLQILDWQTSQLGGGAGNPVSVGLHRFEGRAAAGDELLQWSVVLKMIQSPENVGWENMGGDDDPAHWNYWKRELYLYRSGLLETLPQGLAAPRCFGAIELPGRTAWLWLEDIRDTYHGDWPLERYALAARHLGLFNGVYCSNRPLPVDAWLSVNGVQHRSVTFPIWQVIPWEHPQVRKRYPGFQKNVLRRMLFENERYFAKLDQLPKTLCHGDTYPSNLKSRTQNDGQEQTVALDWALAGTAPLGDDLGQLVLGASLNLQEIDRTLIDQLLFENYLDGLRDSGCLADPIQVRFGYTALAAFRVGMFNLFMLNEEIKHSGTALEEAVEDRDTGSRLEVDFAEQAYQLLDRF